MLNNTLPEQAKLECPLGHTCNKCLWFRCMPVDVADPTSGEVLRKETVWDCVLAWNMLGAWDAGRQAQGVHAATAQQTNETIRRQDLLLEVVTQGRYTAPGTPQVPGPPNRPKLVEVDDREGSPEP